MLCLVCWKLLHAICFLLVAVAKYLPLELALLRPYVYDAMKWKSNVNKVWNEEKKGETEGTTTNDCSHKLGCRSLKSDLKVSWDSVGILSVLTFLRKRKSCVISFA